jgi:hypothetical protein
VMKSAMRRAGGGREAACIEGERTRRWTTGETLA